MTLINDIHESCVSTVPRFASNGEKVSDYPQMWTKLHNTLDLQGIAVWTKICYVCLNCGELGETVNQQNRDALVAHFDFVGKCRCGKKSNTVLFYTETA